MAYVRTYVYECMYLYVSHLLCMYVENCVYIMTYMYILGTLIGSDNCCVTYTVTMVDVRSCTRPPRSPTHPPEESMFNTC